MFENCVNLYGVIQSPETLGGPVALSEPFGGPTQYNALANHPAVGFASWQ